MYKILAFVKNLSSVAGRWRDVRGALPRQLRSIDGPCRCATIYVYSQRKQRSRPSKVYTNISHNNIMLSTSRSPHYVPKFRNNPFWIPLQNLKIFSYTIFLHREKYILIVLSLLRDLAWSGFLSYFLLKQKHFKWFENERIYN